jgi:hypothetical protein
VFPGVAGNQLDSEEQAARKNEKQPVSTDASFRVNMSRQFMGDLEGGLDRAPWLA